MKIFVELPQPLEIGRDEKITVLVIEENAFITINGEGAVTYQGAGGGAPTFSVNLSSIANAIRQETRLNTT